MNARCRMLLMAPALSASLAIAAGVEPGEFAWRASLELPAGASLARVELPAAALARMQSANARDVRVFNAGGEAVPFAWLAPTAPAPAPEEKTRSYPALPLYSTSAGRAAPKGSVQLRVDGGTGGPRSVWVQLDGAAPAGEQRLNAVLFGMKDERKAIGALDVQATLPPNLPVRVAVSTSTDLATWTSAPVRGRLYRFEGEGAPVNLRLEFEHPLTVEGRFVRLDWDGQPGVAIASITGVTTAAIAPRRLRAELPALHEVAADAMEVETGFATPIAALALATARDNTLVPVRVMGRNDASQPWRVLGETVVYRLGAGADAVANPPLELHDASVRMLRIVAGNGATLAAAKLSAAALLQPVQLVLVASGPAPYTIAAGRDRTEAAALPLPSIAGALGGRRPEDLPLAKIGDSAESAAPNPWSAYGWRGVPGKTVVLWAVLAAGVLLLAGVAWSLLRQMKESRAP